MMTTDPPTPDDPVRELRQLVDAGRFREALEAHTRSGARAARVPEAELLAATAATRLGELGRGVTLAEAAVERFRTRADTDGRMRAMNLLGAIAFEHGRLEEAERCFGEALELARVLEDARVAAHASNNLASVAHLRNRSDLALSLYRIALLGYQRIGDRRGTAQTYHNLGLTFRQQRDWDDAESAAFQAVRHAEEVGEGSLLALAVMGRAEIHLDRGELTLARQELLRAEQLAQGAHDEVGIAEVGRLRALLTLREGRPAEAMALALASRGIAERLGILQLRAECAGVAAAACRQLGRTTDAEHHLAEAREIFQRLGAERLKEELERMLQ
jgi:tetratricopeptide (TPR) repeat protein